MRKVLFLLMSITLVLSGCKTQDPAVKEAKNAEREFKFQKAVEALNSQDFVLEADRINFKNGRYSYVSSNTNFISMSGDNATIQLAFNSPYAGPNGMGGITVEGRASNVKTKTDKKGNITFSMNVFGTGVSAIVTINMVAGSNQCTAIVTPNFNSRVITFSGYLYPKSESTVFKGRAL
uniref:DUF4251 domain-containing protein n=1 Tax=uncultured Dysgonomonas sp. TaxID=206096 RepID=UPI00261DD43D|nr:DUF4251 domain-containing protein [uncultured Dysgonomonas sp.]